MKNELLKNLIIFEMANNHQGDVSHGIKIIRKLGEVAAKYGINAAVKFQYRDLDTMIHPDYRNRTDVKHIPRFLSTRLTNDEFYEMVVEAKKVGLHTMCTPFDEKSVDVIMDHGIEIIKIASCSAVDWPLLEKVATTLKPVILSSGGKTFGQLDSVYSFFKKKNVDFAMLHCVGMYPVKDEDVQLCCLTQMQNRYPHILIGYSGHEDPKDFTISKMAVGMGAEILERHVGLATESIKLNAYSTDVNDIGGWIEAILSARKIRGNGVVKAIPDSEAKSMEELARGSYAARDIKKGETIHKEDVFFAMPCQSGQVTSGMFVDGMTASCDYPKNAAICENEKKTPATDIESIVRDVKSMLFDAKIPLVSGCFELELSHHYGLEHFRHYGATIINIINREYCKKLIVVLPGQQHPNHSHKVKEESFQVLYGIMTLTLDGVTRDLTNCEVATVERGKAHSFTSRGGCIFEEVSTTHVKNDSYYEDEKIAALSLEQRKTVLENW